MPKTLGTVLVVVACWAVLYLLMGVWAYFSHRHYCKSHSAQDGGVPINFFRAVLLWPFSDKI